MLLPFGAYLKGDGGNWPSFHAAIRRSIRDVQAVCGLAFIGNVDYSDSTLVFCCSGPSGLLNWVTFACVTHRHQAHDLSYRLNLFQATAKNGVAICSIECSFQTRSEHVEWAGDRSWESAKRSDTPLCRAAPSDQPDAAVRSDIVNRLPTSATCMNLLKLPPYRK